MTARAATGNDRRQKVHARRLVLPTRGALISDHPFGLEVANGPDSFPYRDPGDPEAEVGSPRR